MYIYLPESVESNVFIFHAAKVYDSVHEVTSKVGPDDTCVKNTDNQILFGESIS